MKEEIAMGSYGQYCPVARAAEIFADRWTPLIMREMLQGICRFNELERSLPGIPRSLLSQRLRSLAKTGVIARHVASNGRATEYHLTQAGQQLEAVVDLLGAWGAQWAFGEPEPDELDPGLLLWWMQRRVNFHLLPAHRIVVQFDFRGERTGSYWLVMDPTDVSICLQHPGFDIDLLVTADIAAFYRVWLGRITLAEALRDGLVELDGTTPLVHAFPGWFALSPFADMVRVARANIPKAEGSAAS
jgi:DNA-binding HxlR family transcriptional regulator